MKTDRDTNETECAMLAIIFENPRQFARYLDARDPALLATLETLLAFSDEALGASLARCNEVKREQVLGKIARVFSRTLTHQKQGTILRMMIEGVLKPKGQG